MIAQTEVVRVDQVVKDFRPGFGIRRKRVLHGISFVVNQGEIFGFVGPNGAGKTTTLKVLMGLIRASEGSARILGHDVSETEFRRHIGFLPENPYFYDYLTAREFMQTCATLSGCPKDGLDRGSIGSWIGSVWIPTKGDGSASSPRACSSGSVWPRR